MIKAKKIYIIYVPGLGDDSINGQRLAVKTWRLWGVESELLAMDWGSKEAWAIKLNRLLKRIDYLASQNRQIALVGSSAGASAVINAFAARQQQLIGCVLIAGKINRPEVICPRYFIKNPAFQASAYNCQSSLATLDLLQRKRILSLYALFDETVNKKDSYVEGAVNHSVPTIGHVFTIASQLIFGAPRFTKFLKKLAKLSS